MASASLPPDLRLAMTMRGCHGRSICPVGNVVWESPPPPASGEVGERLSSDEVEERDERCRPAEGDLVITEVNEEKSEM